MPKKLKVLYVESGSGYGGSAESLYQLLKAVRNNRVKAYAFLYFDSPIVQKIRDLGVPVWIKEKKHIQKAKGYKRVVLFIFWEFNAMLSLISVILRNGIQFVHLNNDLDSHRPGCIAAAITRRRIYFHLRGIRPWTRSEMMLRRFVYRWIAVSRAVKLQLMNHGVPEDRISVIHNKISLPEMLEAKDCSSKTFTIGNFNRWALGKGHDQFLEAMGQLSEKYDAFRVLMLEPKSRSVPWIRETLDIMKKYPKLKERLTFLPWTNNISEYLTQCHVLVNPSHLEEAFGRLLIEAMASNVAVVATDVGGHVEIISHKVNGLLISPRKPDEIVDAVLQLIRKPELRALLCENGVTSIHNKFTAETYGFEVVAAYFKVSGSYYGTKKTFREQVKSLLCILGFYSGAFLIYLRFFKPKSEAMILMYHHIKANDRHDLSGVSEATFDSQMAYLSKHFNVVSLREMVAILKQKKKIPRNTIAITFDDGYENFYTKAYPILKKYRVPATVYLVSHAIEKKETIWTERIASVIKSAKLDRIELKFNGTHLIYPLTSEEERGLALKEIKGTLKRVSNRDRNAALSAFDRAYAQEEGGGADNSDMMSWSQVTDMDAELVNIGAHTMTHPILSRLSSTEAEREISGSKAFIEEKLGRPIYDFCYPNGEATDYNEEVKKITEEAGFESSCTTILGHNDEKTNRYELFRTYVRNEPLYSLMARIVGVIQ